MDWVPLHLFVSSHSLQGKKAYRALQGALGLKRDKSVALSCAITAQRTVHLIDADSRCRLRHEEAAMRSFVGRLSRKKGKIHIS